MRWISQLSSKAGRREADFYATPPSALAPLLDECPPPMWLVIEPAAGDGVEASNPWRKFWEAHPWTNRVVLWKRPSFTGHGTDACNYFWAVWRRA